MSTYRRALHIFRRDLRIQDNTALNAALAGADEVITCFIFNDAQVGSHKHRSTNGLCFMIESLEELATEVSERGGNLFFFHGDHSAVVGNLITDMKIDAVYFNKDYTPFSRKRDQSIEAACAERGIACHQFSDALLCEPSSFGKDDGRPYSVYTPFFKRASKEAVARPSKLTKGTFARPRTSQKLVEPRDFWPEESATERVSKGGRSQALAILKGIKSYANYEDERNIPALKGTTLLGPHNKFGTVSIREVYHIIADALGVGHTLIREIYWRDFFTHIAWHFPHVFGHAFYRHYDAIEWSKDMKLFNAWCEGRTGFPIVDAGMRELVTTGFMHNRVRMIVASFLVKDLHLSWRWGEAFFARHLTDYDPSVNNGSWQWAASTGCDAQPYFRIFNPWLQQKRFDPDCIYIKRWIPELKNMTTKAIHDLNDSEKPRPERYPPPIVDHSLQKIGAEEMFKACQPAKR
jgi:deoxyribodipyrimidine photo-lyase